jgi:beta-phosphoglucomutase-like phosphatase (HAD superfamily)
MNRRSSFGARYCVAELVIFDCDGVLVDSDRISLRIQAERISLLGLETSYEDCVRDFLGLGMEATLEILTEHLGRPVPKRLGLPAARRPIVPGGISPMHSIIVRHPGR